MTGAHRWIGLSPGKRPEPSCGWAAHLERYQFVSRLHACGSWGQQRFPLVSAEEACRRAVEDAPGPGGRGVDEPALSTSPSPVVHRSVPVGPHPALGLSTLTHNLLHSMCPGVRGTGARLCPQSCPHAVHEAWSNATVAPVRASHVTQSHPCSHWPRPWPRRAVRAVGSRWVPHLRARETAGGRLRGWYE